MRKPTNIIVGVILCLILSLCFAGTAYALDINEGGEYNLAVVRSEVNIYTTAPVTLTGKLNGQISCFVEGVTLTLRGVKVTSDEYCALSFTGADNTLILEERNGIKSDGRNPGIRVEEGTTLTIRGDGSLKATGGNGGGAGIGGGDCETGGTIIIESGDITAVGGYSAAGIGGGSCRDGGTIVISGGTVTASGGDGGAGIGGAGDNGFDKILITGGTIIASSDEGGCGIGQGWNSGKFIPGGEITITGGTITANGGIGGGCANNAGFITIEGGDITSNGPIGGGGVSFRENIREGLITISGGTILADGGIGPTSDIIISGGDITAIGIVNCAGIDASIAGESEVNEKKIKITGGTIVAIGGGGAAGIGGSSFFTTRTIEISGGTISATGGDPHMPNGGGWDEGFRFGGGAGIGGGCFGCGGSIIISGGTVRATGGEEGAGIGTGTNGYYNEINIYGGTVEAIGGDYGAGIGGGRNSEAVYTKIGGNSLVYAIRGEGDTDDIGAGDGTNIGGGPGISEAAAVFLGTNRSKRPETNYHTYQTPDSTSYPMIARGEPGAEAIYGIEGTGVSPWADAEIGYFVLYYLKYDTNGGEGELPESARAYHITAAATVANGEGLQKSGSVFSGWNTRADGSGKLYLPGDKVTCWSPEKNITLYAQWENVDD